MHSEHHKLGPLVVATLPGASPRASSILAVMQILPRHLWAFEEMNYF